MSTKSDSKPRERSKLSYQHHIENKQIKDGEVVLVEEESVMDGPKGISFKYYQKKGGNILKVTGRQESDKTFSVKVIKNGVTSTEEKGLSVADTLKIISKMKELDFVVKYLSKAKKMSRSSRSLSRSGSRKRAGSKRKKGTKKKSTKKKATKKRTRKGSRKKSRRGSRKK